MQLSLEQKAYLKSIKSKKKRKAQKLDFKAHNFIFGHDYSETFESISNKLKDINDIKVEYNLVKEEPNKKILFTIDECTPFTKEMLESLTKPKQENKLEYTLEDIEKSFESARVTKEPFTKDYFFKDFEEYLKLKLMPK